MADQSTTAGEQPASPTPNPEPSLALCLRRRFPGLDPEPLREPEQRLRAAVELTLGDKSKEAWQKLDDAYAATKPLEAIRRDTTRLRQDTALWESYIDYRLDLETWDAALQRAARTTDPALAPRRYAELDELGTRLERSTPPAAVSSAAVENLRKRIRAEKTRLGLLALEGTASPAALHRIPIDELLAHYRLAGKLFTGHAALPAAVADSLRQRRTALLRAIGGRAGTDIDRELQAHRWQRAEAHARRPRTTSPRTPR